MIQITGTSKASPKHRRIAATTTAILAASLAVVSAHAAISQTIAKGTVQHSELVGGPATMTMRTLTIAPGEVLGWHSHDGIGAFTIVVSGTLTVEDGCGGEVVYLKGQAFVEAANRVHRGKNLTGANVVTAQTFLTPVGTPISDSHPQRMCGVPLSVKECKSDGWKAFNFPQRFGSQGACIAFVNENR